jgi:hypothetical protein
MENILGRNLPYLSGVKMHADFRQHFTYTHTHNALENMLNE